MNKTDAQLRPSYFPAPADGCLSLAMTAAYRRDGFLILEDFIPAKACDALITRAKELVDAYQPGPELTVFSTKNQAHKSADYFQSSGDKIRFFFEEEAFDEDGGLSRPKALAINKIGHALHDLDPVFERFSRAPRLAALAAGLGYRQARLLQSMYIFKQPLIGGEVNCHQDATFLYTEPPSCTGFWFALQDATLENGCLHAIPGRHPLRQRFRRTPQRLRMDTLDDRPWPKSGRIPLAARKGTLVVLDGLLPHLSGANRAPYSRHAYTLHIIEGDQPYPADNWLQRAPDMPLRGF